MIPFSPPRIDEKTIAAVTEVLRSGWITTGPKTRELEKKISDYTSSKKTLCLNSWTNAAELALRWFGIGPGDEVIVPAYTYAATANIVVHLGATPVIVDSSANDFNIDIEQLRQKISSRTKAIIPVDIGGLPVDYDAVMNLLKSEPVRKIFQPSGEVQSQLGRPLVLSDAAHSFGAKYKNAKAGNQTDISGFSFHAVKNLTTAEGGALCLNLPQPVDNDAVWQSLNISALHGQTKDAFAKTQAGQWRYDIVEAGFKCNLTDIHAAIGLVELERYDEETLPRRKNICDVYMKAFSNFDWFIAPTFKDEIRESSYHLFMLRVRDIDEQKRDDIIQTISQKGVSVNVHFQPLPLLSYYKNLGFDIADFPNAYGHYSCEISLPVYFDLNDEQMKVVIDVVTDSIQKHS
ncbi:MAG: DegT/DnrJ/EryC1/StrS family aminotransferase [Flavobacteriales bacterium]|nr:DegT/DnrJ/EryC1/StrS family aminotransferase [Flavobacteriales bacterium]